MSFETPQPEHREAGAGHAPAHDEAAVERAVRALTPENLKRLRAVAYALVRGLGLERAGRDHDDLLSESLLRTLGGSRRWRRGVELSHHLVQTMRSVAWKWRDSQDRRERAGLAAPAEGEPINEPVAPQPDVEAALVTSAELRAFQRHFSEDRIAGIVLNGWERGESMKEIARRTGFHPKELQWAARRIRRFAQRRSRGDRHGH